MKPAVFALSLVFLTACANDPATGICNMPAIATMTLVYPENGAVAVPDATNEIIVATQGGTQSASVTLSPAPANQPASSFTAAPSPLPSPYATPQTGTGWNDYAVPMGTLAAGTKYTVNYTVSFGGTPSPGGCPTSVTQSIGTFTTQ